MVSNVYDQCSKYADAFIYAKVDILGNLQIELKTFIWKMGRYLVISAIIGWSKILEIY